VEQVIKLFFGLYSDMEVLPFACYCTGRLVRRFLSSTVRDRQRTSDMTYCCSFWLLPVSLLSWTYWFSA